MASTQTASCTIAVEGTDTKLYRSDKSHPDGDDSFLHLLIPILHRYRNQRYQD
jgi:hypothetical protein